MLKFEAQNNGSLLNFLSQPQQVEAVVRAVERALKSGRLEVYVPYFDSVLSRYLAVYPWFLDRLYPSLEWIGRRGLKKYLNKLGNRN